MTPMDGRRGRGGRGDKPFESIHGPYGATTAHPMSFQSADRLVYIPAQNVPRKPHGGGIGLDAQFPTKSRQPIRNGWNLGLFRHVEPPKSLSIRPLIAWDPRQQQQVWKQDYVSPWNGGTRTHRLANLVFQG